MDNSGVGVILAATGEVSFLHGGNKELGALHCRVVKPVVRHVCPFACHVLQLTTVCSYHLRMQQNLSSSAINQINEITNKVVSSSLLTQAKSNELPLEVAAGITEFHLFGHGAIMTPMPSKCKLELCS
ncbi:hypothetical protein ATN89_17210 [Comamonas thiooxydans]|nr:hypothetical protein ATN89_17210 [Comamonas thiooxydans]